MRRIPILLAAALLAAVIFPATALAAAPVNDNFADAIEISALPAYVPADLTEATIEAGEPVCPDQSNGSVWFKYTATSDKPIIAGAIGPWPVLGVYAGTAVNDLSRVGCGNPFGGYPLRPTIGVTYYFQLGDAYPGSSDTFWLEETPPPNVTFGVYPYDPSTLDMATFNDFTYDQYAEVATRAWDLGDGTVASGGSVTHRYASDGDYTVRLGVTMTDGRTGSTSQLVSVRTRDASITSMWAPTSAVMGKTIRITVNVTNHRSPQTVTVRLYRSAGSTWADTGWLQQTLPTMSKNKSVPFLFSYTVTAEDAVAGKLLFRAVAETSGRDVFPADNEAITPPVRISR